MIDLLDIFNGKYEQTFVGTHYPKMPNNDIAGVKFDYEQLDNGTAVEIIEGIEEAIAQAEKEEEKIETPALDRVCAISLE